LKYNVSNATLLVFRVSFSRTFSKISLLSRLVKDAGLLSKPTLVVYQHGSSHISGGIGPLLMTGGDFTGSGPDQK
jgi:hypothetical protein